MLRRHAVTAIAPLTHVPYKPRRIVQRLAQEIAKALRQPDVQAKLATTMGMEIVAGGPEQLAAPMAREIPRWAALAGKSGASAN